MSDNQVNRRRRRRPVGISDEGQLVDEKGSFDTLKDLEEKKQQYDEALKALKEEKQKYEELAKEFEEKRQQTFNDRRNSNEDVVDDRRHINRIPFFLVLTVVVIIIAAILFGSDIWNIDDNNDSFVKESEDNVESILVPVSVPIVTSNPTSTPIPVPTSTPIPPNDNPDEFLKDFIGCVFLDKDDEHEQFAILKKDDDGYSITTFVYDGQGGTSQGRPRRYELVPRDEYPNGYENTNGVLLRIPELVLDDVIMYKLCHYENGEKRLLVVWRTADDMKWVHEGEEYVHADSFSSEDEVWEYVSSRKESYQNGLKSREPAIGMTQLEVISSAWGYPERRNKTTYSWGTTEQWVYRNGKYVYFTDGIVDAIQE